MKRPRSKLLAMMEILHALRGGPTIRTRLAQVCNLNYDRMLHDLDDLEKQGLIGHREEEGHTVYYLTEDGLKRSMNYDWMNAMALGGEGWQRTDASQRPGF